MLDTEDCPIASLNGTFRDPQGRLYQDGNRILRIIYAEHTKSALEWIGSPLARRWIRQGRLITTRIVSADVGQSALLEHERVFFPSYPWEWCPGQWKAAASLTLDLCDEAIGHGYILKDATPLNILFSGSEAVFVDVLSIEKRDPCGSLWMAHAQFLRTFLLPLAANIYLGWPLSATQNRRDGYDSADLYPNLPFFRRWQRPLRSLVTLPLLFENGRLSKFEHWCSRRIANSPELSPAILRHTLNSARKLLDSLKTPSWASRWGSYTETATHYSREDRLAKQEFVRRSLREFRPSRVLDVGANTGVYSAIAAETGAEVVAWDSDVQAVEKHWQRARVEKGSILPLVVDFARPTPAVGWQNSEGRSLLHRAAARFDCVLMLGILHHLTIADQIPLPMILDQLASFTTQWIIVEWIPREDSQFVSLCRGREKLFAHLSEEYFLKGLGKHFLVHKCCRLSNGRVLVAARKIQ